MSKNAETGTDPESQELLQALKKKIPRPADADIALGFLTPTVKVWRSRKWIPYKHRPKVRAFVNSSTTVGITAPTMHPILGRLTAPEETMANADPSLRKAVSDLDAIYLGRNVDPELWEGVCRFLARSVQFLRQKQTTPEPKENLPTKVRPMKRKPPFAL